MYMLHRVGIVFGLTLRIRNVRWCRSGSLIVLIVLSARFADVLRRKNNLLFHLLHSFV